MTKYNLTPSRTFKIDENNDFGAINIVVLFNLFDCQIITKPQLKRDRWPLYWTIIGWAIHLYIRFIPHKKKNKIKYIIRLLKAVYCQPQRLCMPSSYR